MLLTFQIFLPSACWIFYIQNFLPLWTCLQLKNYLMICKARRESIGLSGWDGVFHHRHLYVIQLLLKGCVHQSAWIPRWLCQEGPSRNTRICVRARQGAWIATFDGLWLGSGSTAVQWHAAWFIIPEAFIKVWSSSHLDCCIYCRFFPVSDASAIKLVLYQNPVSSSKSHSSTSWMTGDTSWFSSSPIYAPPTTKFLQ